MAVKLPDYYRGDRTDFLDWVGGRHDRVLDVGCGAGAAGPWFRSHGASRVVGVEIDPESATNAGQVYDVVVNKPIEAALDGLVGPFDLVVCADVLEHLVDPWTVLERLRRVADGGTILAVSCPNIRYLPALWRIAVGRGFDYEERGIFDQTHLRFFTRSDVARMLRRAGWMPRRWAAPPAQRHRFVRRSLRVVTRGRSDDWLGSQVYVVCTPAGVGRGGSRSPRPAGG